MKKLDYFIKKDPRIKKVYDYAKEKYNKANLVQHNWAHVLRDLYRALVIAEEESGVNYNVLIPAVILHDIGVTEGKYSEHEEKGPRIVRRDLSKLGYCKEEIEKILADHCLPKDFYDMSFEDFLKERRKLMAKMVRTIFESL